MTTFDIIVITIFAMILPFAIWAIYVYTKGRIFIAEDLQRKGYKLKRVDFWYGPVMEKDDENT